jgi:8-oxo-dGTP pyrophosphatase MutT (NUDIX family)
MFAFNDALRRDVADRCAAFPRLVASDAAGSLKRSAVAITLLETQDGSGMAGFLLTRRAKGLRAHSGQWALPGGRCDQAETLVEAVLRELDEEVGLRLGESDVLGLLDDYPTRSGYCITPVVLWAGDNPQLRSNPREVASLHRIALSEIMQPDAVDFVAIPESDKKVIRIRVDGSLIHAPTGAMIYQFRELLAGRTTRVADLDQPVFAWR